jgi:serpin B
MTSRSFKLSSLLAAVLALAGCSQELPDAPGELIASDKQRVTEPDVSAEDLASIAAANTDFGVALYRQVAKPGENFFFSPFSISQAFSMVYAGARGNTEQQMQQALHFTLPQERLHPAMNALDLVLQRPVKPKPGQKGSPPTFRLVNGTWGQQGFAFEPRYLDTLALHYGAGVRAVDFQSDAEALRTQINDWVAGQTEDRIKNLLPSGFVTSDTRLVLVNALYFKGSWANQFEPTRTRSATFHQLDGSETQAQMMEREGALASMRGDGFMALALPYVGDASRMLLIVPDSGRFSEVEARLSASFLDGIRQGLNNTDAVLRLPKFQVEAGFALPDAMKALGMVDAFNESADLSGISTQANLYITGAQHKAFVAVDETGTEAAAATGVGVGDESIPPLVTVDRPFLFLIEDVETKSVLFLGRLLKP